MKKALAVLCVLMFLWTLGCTRTSAPTDGAESTALPQTCVQTEPRTEPETTAQTTTETQTQTQTQAQTSVPSTADTTAAHTQTTSQTTAESNQTNALDKIKEGLENLRTDIPRKKDKDFFNDAVFVGDSVTLGLKNYTTSRRNKGEACLGTAQFLCCGSMGYTNALSPVSANSLHPTYKGKKVSVEDGIALCAAKKVFIMLGMNDFCAYSKSTCQKSVATLIDRIQSKNPGIEIYIQSVTPIVDGMEHGTFNNTNMAKFNDFLRTFCEERRFVYVDISACVMQDDTGHLKKDYCGDPAAMGIHMNSAGSRAWVDYLTAEFCGN